MAARTVADQTEPPTERHASVEEAVSRQPAGGDLRRRQIIAIVLLALGLRLITVPLAFLSNLVFPLYQREQFTVFHQTNAFWDTFARYDSGAYYSVAHGGYRFVAGGRSNLAYFPLYPILMRYLGRLLGGHQADFYRAGVILSWTAFILAMLMLYRVARLDLPRRAADRAVVYAAIFPFAFFFGVVYPESLFLLLTLASVYGFRTKRWALGGVCGGLASSTRVNGIMALPALACMAWRSAGADARERGRALGALALVAGGLAVYSGYVYTLSGSFIEWAHSIQRWGYHPGGPPWAPLVALARALATHPYAYLTTEHAAPYDLLNGGTALVCLVSIPFVWARFGAGYGLFMLANLWLPLSSGAFEGLGRYCAVLFPFFIWLATFRSQTTRTCILVGSAMLYMLCLALFTRIYPIF